MTVAMHKQST